VYYAYSYRQLVQNQAAVQAYSIAEAAGCRGIMGDVNAGMRAAYDADTTGRGAPHTDFVSRASLRWLCREFTEVEMSLKNIAQETPFAATRRESLLESEWPAKVGLDLYAIATRGA